MVPLSIQIARPTVSALVLRKALRVITRYPAVTVLSVLSFATEFLPAHDVRTEAVRPRHPTVSDAIEMTNVARDEGVPQGQSPIDFSDVGILSPDGKRVVLVVKKGNLQRNTNDFTLLMWDGQSVLSKGSVSPKQLLTMSSSSNESAIADVRWLPDGASLVFLAEPEGETRQVYTLDVRTGQLLKKTHASGSVLSYGISATGKTLAYVVDQPVHLLKDDDVRRHGLVIRPGDSIGDIVRGEPAGSLGASGLARQGSVLYVSDDAGTRRITTTDIIPFWGPAPLLSPDGQFIIIYTFVAQPPEAWSEYQDPQIRDAAAAKVPDILYRFELIDVSTGVSRPLLDTPFIINFPSVAWAPDSRSVALAGVYLPLQGVLPADQRDRRRRTYVIEVSVPERQIGVVAPEDPVVDTSAASMSGNWLRRSSWTRADSFYVTTAKWTHYSKTAMTSVYRRQGTRWQTVGHHAVEPRYKVVAFEDVTSPPKLFVKKNRPSRTTFLMDLNPQFSDVKFCDVKEVSWEGSDREVFKGGLYYPCEYVPGRRYPLVIQTHGWYPTEFGITGPTHTAFAAQPLAAAGVFVLQADESFADFGTLKEIEREVSRFETAADYLESRALIDRSRVGIIGFSRTGDFVAWALVHSKARFAAATIEDGYSLGLPQYFTSNLAANNGLNSFYQNIYGGLPFGENLELWSKRSPTLNLDKVHTPLRVVAIGPGSLIGHIEFQTGLNALHKPVEVLYLPEGTHDLQKPWERMASLQGNVDWYRFWLQGYEDPDQSKSGQYRRWEKLCDMQRSASPDRPASCVGTKQ